MSQEASPPVLLPSRDGDLLTGNQRRVKIVFYEGRWVPMIWISPYTIQTNIVENGPMITCRKFIGLYDNGSPAYPLPQVLILTIPEEDLAKLPEAIIES